MRNPAAQGRTDSNHTEIVRAYEEMFCSVVELHKVGFGCPDLMVGCAGRTELVEVKTEHGQLEPSQIRFQNDWRGSKVVIVRTAIDAQNHVLNIREKQATGKWGTNGKK